MNFNKSLTYSFLAYHNNQNKDIMRVFIPLIKKAFLKFEKSNNKYYGDLNEVKRSIKEEFKLDIPIRMLKRMIELMQIEDSRICLYNDSYIKITERIVFEYDSILEEKQKEIEAIDEDYNNFLISEGIESAPAILDFIENNKKLFCQLINGENCKNANGEYIPVARYINQIKNNQDKFKIIQEIFLGSIISCYISTDISEQKIDKKVKLVLDTNFIVSLMGLHSKESNITCKQLYEIANDFGFEFIVLDITIAETKNLLLKKARELGEIKIQGFVQDDFLNNCLEKEITKTDLQRKARNLKSILEKEFLLKIVKVEKSLKIEAKKTELYRDLKQRKHNQDGAEHDAVAILYTKKMRKEKVEKFEEAASWFLQDQRGNKRSIYNHYGELKVKITASLLLNILWLANPAKSSNIDSFARVNLLELVQINLAEVLPEVSQINELRDNVIKYQGEVIDDNELVFLAQSISSKSVLQSEVKKLNISAKISDYEFATNFDNIMGKLKKREEQKYEVKNKKIAEKDQLLLQEKKKRRKSIKERTEEVYDLLNDFYNRKDKADGFIKSKCRRNFCLVPIVFILIAGTVYLNDQIGIIKTSHYLTLLTILIPVSVIILKETDFFKKFFMSEAENNHYLDISYNKFDCCSEREDKLLDKKTELEEELAKLEEEILKVG
ncbi:hypothetical protein HSACCH_02427 [Halanaerobium saccharolyticum subsp. saccharolyticum DSM 6643]|uniref:PIN domain-containing protein n=1 Tax=Halanaerobium saccharolyticum subsp. saccharolyticum DSM 6643 TaxID=1293054 RepID=M5E4M1_9FIRM|nr:hypothetical protein [Halanaerobium saccharolyticum]CCU80925.1 hypothetical protein HSACCH_02427 [Halanaerobium saccharolyticum subsp. saccharolyticum DSM 6643]